jgi:lipoprotein-anchoring transpeptidase ErfK/SrfK
MLLGGNGGGSQQRDWTHVTSRKLVPFSRNYETGTIVVSFADRRLYLVQKPGQAYSYLIGTPVLEEKWQGVLNVSDKRVDPRWVPTPDMRRKDPTLPLAVAGGDPRNPLGRRALYLGDTLYRIHGTDAPWTVGQEISNGCVRLYNRDILDLYNRVPMGTKVVVTWDRFMRVASSNARTRLSSAEQRW